MFLMSEVPLYCRPRGPTRLRPGLVHPPPASHAPANSRFRFSGLGFRFSGLGFQASGFGFRVLGLGLRVSGFGSRVSGFGFRVSGLGSRVYLLLLYHSLA